MVKEELVKEWLSKGKKNIEDAQFLLDNDRALENVAFHIQQSAEKYLKGFLIHHGWKLEKIHDLVKLVEEAIKVDKSFSKFIKLMRKITNFYFESRYPVGYEVEYTKEELKDSIKKIQELVDMIHKKLNFKNLK